MTHNSSNEYCDSCARAINGNTTSFTPVGNAESTATPPNVSAQPLLSVVKGPGVGETFYLNTDEVTIGRDPRADIFLNDLTVSRQHATVVRIGKTVIVRDAESLNGTYVNGLCVDETELHSGDVVQIGTFHLLYTE